MSRSQTAEQRFDARYSPDPKTGCWNWTAGKGGTQLDNMADMAAKGRNGQPRGERHPRTNLTGDRVLAICALVGGHSNRAIARMVGSTPGTVSNIARGRTWGWLTGRVGEPIGEGS